MRKDLRIESKEGQPLGVDRGQVNRRWIEELWSEIRKPRVRFIEGAQGD